VPGMEIREVAWGPGPVGGPATLCLVLFLTFLTTPW